ncbi:nSTAND1 domain-containing NTPase [Streptomyces noboritoensis]|uniref:nSTAND1 domain-containing NTPase n=1 Tax=Streptomyces noboritoensis TaxID=67337 RepID=UPI00406BFA94
MTRREGFVVRIRHATAEPPMAAGVGCVVGERHIVTCAHVINAALGRDEADRERPPDSARIRVDFPLLGDAEGAPLRECRVAAWDPPAAPGLGGRDTAGLVVVGDTLPVGAGPARLVAVPGGGAEDVRAGVFGYPASPFRTASGAWSSCRLRGAVGGGLVQLDAESESALRAQPGYSGAPVIVGDAWGDAVVGMLAVAGREGRAGDAYAVPMTEVSAAWPEVLGDSMLPPCPYRGLRSFTAADARAGLFVGREREIAGLRAMVKDRPLVVVTGPSGVGKSSLVAAGLEPGLLADGWAVATFRPGATPYDALARALLDLECPGGDHSLEQLENRCRALREEGFWPVATRVSVLTGRRLALIGDQFEEVFSAGTDGADPVRFLQQTFPPPETVQSPDVRLVCTLRSDFLPDLLELADIGPRLQDRQLNVSPLDEAALTRVIVEPAALAGVTFTEGLAEAVAAEASKGPGGLPLLEFALTELWPMQRERRISFDSYHGLGGVSGALNRHAEQVYRFLAQTLDAARIRRVLLSMIRARGGAASAVRVAARRVHLGADWYVAQLMADPERRLVVLGPEGPGTAEIAHEALIRGWQRLADWVDEDADFQQWLAVAEERATEGDLLSAPRVAEAQRWLDERPDDIPPEVGALMRRSLAVLREQERTERQMQALQASNAELEEKAELLARANRDIEVKNHEIEEARQILQERAELLAVSMRFRSEFLANMSHELRTPLNSMLILAKLLADNNEGTLSQRQIEFAETIHRAGSDLLELINDILDLTRVEAGRMEVAPTWIGLAALLDHVEATFRPLMEDKGIDFSVSLAPGVSTELYTDEQRLLQVLRNLLANAVKFTDADGAVELRVGRLGPRMVFSVSDSGIGIPADKIQVIFDAFQQADGTTSRRYGGTGLGLSISREIAGLLGGEIRCESEVGRGSTFTLDLPRGPVAETSDDVDPLPEETPALLPLFTGRFAGEHVLVVDDDVRNVFALTSVLEQNGLTVWYAESGQEAIDMLEGRPGVDLVLMDVMMPEMDGNETMKRIRRIPGYEALPVVALTAKAMADDRERSIEAGASAYLTKPVDTDALLTVIEKWLPRGEAGPGAAPPD